MNKKQIVVLWLGIVAATLILLFPVTRRYDSGMRPVLGGESWTAPMRHWYSPTFYVWVTDAKEYRQSVTVPLAIAVIVAGGFFVTFATRRTA